jgi:hypothetical protein
VSISLLRRRANDAELPVVTALDYPNTNGVNPAVALPGAADNSAQASRCSSSGASSDSSVIIPRLSRAYVSAAAESRARSQRAAAV